MPRSKKITVNMSPSPHTIGDGVSGIHTVIRAYGKLLPKRGIEFVKPDTPADLYIAHAGMTTKACDIAMLHGIYFTDDYAATKAEWRANEHVVNSIRRALLVTVPSEWVAETIRRDFRIDPIILPHGIFPDEWKHDFKYQPKTVLWAKNRNYDVCNPEPINEVARRMKAFNFYTTFKSPGAPANVHEIGVQDTESIKKWLSSVSVVLSTVKETWGIMYAEAMAAGTPVVTANYGHVPNLVKHGVTGYIYKAGSVDDMAQGIAWADTYRDTLSENSRVVARGLDWERSADRVARAFKLAVRLKQSEKSAGDIVVARQI